MMMMTLTTMTEETIQTTVISQCAECEAEIKRKQKEYIQKDFNFMNKFHPNSYFQDSNGEYFIIVRVICEECQT